MGNCGSSGGGAVRELTEREKTDIRETWEEFNKGDIVSDGAHLYFKLFRDHPESRELFSFAKGQSMSEAEMLEDRKFRGHVEKVYTVIGSAVMEMDDLSELGKDMRELGVKHSKYGVTDKQYAHVGQCILYAFERKMEASFTKDRRRAWVALYAIIEDAMRAGMKGEIHNSRNGQQK